MAILGKELITGLKQMVSNLPKRDLMSFVEVMKRTDKNLNASSNISIETGWFGAWITAFSPHEVDENNIDAHMIVYLERDWDQWKIDLVAEHPSRKHILEEAFRLHEEERYIASIPLFFSQADGICQDRLNGISYFSASRGEQKAYEKIIEIYQKIEGDNINRVKFLLDPFRAEQNHSTKTIISRNSKRVSESEKFPNRHGILHGDPNHLNYGTKVNSLKAYSFLLYIDFILSEIQEQQAKDSR
ncbi:hypothetical protein LCH18_16515 [Acinetobacter johnsonii]|uniref:hypothetical protein n=1 Tax=Acinetobacter johnsonii TaxID=40214 RepID=UPI001CC9E89D|nr:hypothetical protein [Acinetobacter johnsonii]UBQ37718.1 hypothetical protein LCH18_16515 [Acinetobacter johnsonii]